MIYSSVTPVATAAVTIDGSNLMLLGSTVGIEYQGGTAADTITGVAAEILILWWR